jgi:hypothetical protein
MLQVKSEKSYFNLNKNILYRFIMSELELENKGLKEEIEQLRQQVKML